MVDRYCLHVHRYYNYYIQNLKNALLPSNKITFQTLNHILHHRHHRYLFVLGKKGEREKKENQLLGEKYTNTKER